MRQLNRKQAEEIIEKVSDKALGFGPKSGPLPKGATVEDIRRVIDFAVFNAFREAGVLDAMTKQERAENARAADRATAHHRAWCKATGSAF